MSKDNRLLPSTIRRNPAELSGAPSNWQRILEVTRSPDQKFEAKIRLPLQIPEYAVKTQVFKETTARMLSFQRTFHFTFLMGNGPSHFSDAQPFDEPTLDPSECYERAPDPEMDSDEAVPDSTSSSSLAAPEPSETSVPPSQVPGVAHPTAPAPPVGGPQSTVVCGPAPFGGSRPRKKNRIPKRQGPDSQPDPRGRDRRDLQQSFFFKLLGPHIKKQHSQTIQKIGRALLLRGPPCLKDNWNQCVFQRMKCAYGWMDDNQEHISLELLNECLLEVGQSALPFLA